MFYLKTINPHYLLCLLDYLSEVFHTRLALHFGQDSPYQRQEDIPFPFSREGDTPLANLYKENNLSFEEQIIMLMALAPHTRPDFFDQVIRQKLPQAGDFPQLGGVRGKQFRGFMPTGETALFMLAGDDLEKRFQIQQVFNEDHFFAKKNILWLEDPPQGEPRMSGKLVMANEYVDLFTLGKISKPKFGMHFPAQIIETKMHWKDLILNDRIIHQINDLENWINHGQTLLNDWNMRDRIKPGYRVLFYGPPGTGKTLAATLLGKYTGKDVYKIDLSMVVSKFIGETEKNLAQLFAKAENHDWILFFDEADALFGKRTNVRDAHDKYANQEVSYLLQRVETYKGLVILASNFRDNIDEAFVRRFQSIIHFPKPKKEERLKIWKNAFPSKILFDETLNLEKIAEQYELTGANIVNVVQQVCLYALASGNHVINEVLLLESIRREFAKEGKML
ncbi:hypothetical protein BH23BAC1_BH23BAC1_17870 [soil metagenome]